MSKTKALLMSATIAITMVAAVGFALPLEAQTTKVNINLGDRLVNVGAPFRLQDRLEAIRYMLRGVLGRVCHRFPDGFVVGYCVTNGNTNTNTNTNQNTNTNSNTNQNTNTNVNVNSNTNVNGNQNTNTNTNGNTNSGGGSQTPTGSVLLAEIFGASTNNLEWVEIYNGMNVSVDFSGWTISDGSGSDTVPTTTPVIPGGFLLLVATSSPDYLEPLPVGTTKVFVGDSAIGSGFNTSGDLARLSNDSSVEVDAMSFGSNIMVFDPAIPSAPAGQSYYRTSLVTDTNTSSDWGSHVPNPGVGL